MLKKYLPMHVRLSFILLYLCSCGGGGGSGSTIKNNIDEDVHSNDDGIVKELPIVQIPKKGEILYVNGYFKTSWKKDLDIQSIELIKESEVLFKFNITEYDFKEGDFITNCPSIKGEGIRVKIIDINNNIYWSDEFEIEEPLSYGFFHYLTSSSWQLYENSMISMKIFAEELTGQVEIIDDVKIGSLEIIAKNELLYTPPVNFIGSVSYAYKVTYQGQESEILYNKINVIQKISDLSPEPSTNHPPYANSLNYFCPINKEILIQIPSYDMENDQVSIEIINKPAYGTLTKLANGLYNYQAPLIYVGPVKFTYSIADTHHIKQEYVAKIQVGIKWKTELKDFVQRTFKYRDNGDIIILTVNEKLLSLNAETGEFNWISEARGCVNFFLLDDQILSISRLNSSNIFKIHYLDFKSGLEVSKSYTLLNNDIIEIDSIKSVKVYGDYFLYLTYDIDSSKSYINRLSLITGLLEDSNEWLGGFLESTIIHEDIIYFVEDNFLYLYDVNTFGFKNKIEVPYSLSNPPIVHLGKLFFTNSNDTVYCFDLNKSEEPEWSNVLDTYSLSNKIIFEKKLLITLDENKLFAISLSGELLWEKSFETYDGKISNPIIWEGVIYVGSDNHYFYAIDSKDGSLISSFDAGIDLLISIPIIHNDHLIFTNYSSKSIFYSMPLAKKENHRPKSKDISLVVKKSGSINFELFGFDEDRDSLNFSIVEDPKFGSINILENGKVNYQTKVDYIGTDTFKYTVDDGISTSIESIVKIECGINWRTFNKLSNPTAIESYKNMILVKADANKIYCFNKNGSLEYSLDNIAESSEILIKNDILYAAFNDKKIFAFNVLTGEYLWTKQLESQVHTPILATEDKIFFHDKNDTIYALNSHSGETVWFYELPFGSMNTLRYHMILADSKIYVFDQSDTIIELNSNNGDHVALGDYYFVINRIDFTQFKNSFVLDNKIILLDQNHNLYCYDLLLKKIKWSYSNLEIPVVEFIDGQGSVLVSY